ncbi:hypothetical protein [Alicyclobacillus fodiniaquatilis]|uniref:Uncharacterized protein n=1 Tax=Alicyclobacillus fodiniaquatilis TaxID=1661150 RepID=A0ABW4JGG9_9BACL
MNKKNNQGKEATKLIAGFLTKKALMWVIGAIGGPTLFFFFLILIVAGVVANLASSFFGHMFLGFNPNETTEQQQQQSAKVEQVYQNVASEWENGLDTQQQQIVEQFQLDMPYSTLLSLGKLKNNFASKTLQKDAQSYYNFLAPHYHWVKATGETITRHEVTVSGPKGTSTKECKTSTQTFTVWELVSANVWNGTFTATYKSQTTGSFNECSGSETTQPVLASYNMNYDHVRFRNAEYNFKILKQPTNQDDPLPYEIMYSVQPTIYDPMIQAWSSLYGQDPISSDTQGGFSLGGGLGGPAPTVSVAYLKYISINAQQVLNLINSWGTRSYFSVSDIQDIINGAKQMNVNPLLLLAITGAEQDFDSINAYGGEVQKYQTQLKEIDSNPFNLYGFWSVFHPGVNADGSGTPDLADSAVIAARTVASHLTVPPPAGMDAILYINSTLNPTHEVYATDVSWGEHVRTIFWQLSNGMQVKYPGVAG